MRIGWIVAESLQLRFFRSTKLPQAFSQMYHDGELDTQEATRLLQCSVWEEMGCLKHSKKISPLGISGHIWTYLDMGNIWKHSRNCWLRFDHPPNWCKNSTDFTHCAWLAGLIIFQRYVKWCQVFQRMLFKNVQDKVGQSRTKMIKMSSFKFLRSSTAWTSWKTNGRKHPWPLGRRRPKVFPNGLPKSRSETGSSWESPEDWWDQWWSGETVGHRRCGHRWPRWTRADVPRRKPQLPKGRWWSDGHQIITVWLSVTDECRADANSVILRQAILRISFFSSPRRCQDVRKRSLPEAFLAHHSSLAQEYEEGTTKQARSATSVTSPRIIIFLATSHSKVEHVVLVSSQDLALVFYPLVKSQSISAQLLGTF